MTGGGVAARRAVLRWAWRLFRREGRHQALVLALLAVTVAATIVFASAAHNTVGVSEDATFGAANHRYEIDDPDLDTLAADVAAARRRFGAVDVIAQWSRAVPGSVASLEFRAQDPAGPHSHPMLARNEGRYPTAPDEVAVTDGVAATFRLRLGAPFALDGPTRTVVGVVENPSDLHDEFALVAPTDIDEAESVTLLVGGRGRVEEVRDLRRFGGERLPEADLTTRPDVDAAGTVGVLGVAAVALVLVSLVAAAGFVSVAQRRLRQLGLFGAIGGTEKHLRLVVIANGAVIGIAAAGLGGVVGLGAWVATAPRMEAAVGHRIDQANVPWWVVGTAVALVVVTATGAAWWPARVVARVPIVSALSGRPPRPRPARQSAALAAVLTGTGVTALVVVDGESSVLLVAGTITTVVGILLLCPLALWTLGTVARWSPVVTRLALRDLSRYRARAAAALAAISLALGVPVAIVVTATAAEATADAGNVSDRQLLVWTRDAEAPEGVSPYFTQDPNDEGFSPYLPRLTPDDREDRQHDAERIAAGLDATVTGLDLAVDLAAEPTPDGRTAVTLARPTEVGYLDVALVYVATPELLGHYGTDVEDVDSDVLTVPAGERLPPEVQRLLRGEALSFSNTAEPPAPVGTVSELAPRYTSLPGSFVTRDALRRHGWDTVRVGWLVEAAAPLTDGQLVDARQAAAAAGLLVEAREEEADLTTLRWGATAAGTALALGVLAMTVGLIRNQSAGDLRTLTATGATSGMRRALTAATAGGLALLGALLGTAGAYLTLSAGYLDDLGALTPIPFLHLASIAVGLPVAAAAAGWLLAGREPASLTRTARG